MPRTKPLTRYRRDKSVTPIKMTERDREILKTLARMRFLKKEQIARLLFWERGKQEKATREAACQRRLTLLYHNGYLNRFYIPIIPGQGGSPAVNYLGATGKKYLKALGIHVGTINKPSQRTHMFLDHTLAVNDVWVEVEKMHREGVWKLVRWMTPTDIIAEKKRVPAVKGGKWVVPDGYFETIKNGKKSGFFVEVDRGTMTLARFSAKVLSYINYRICGRFARDYGIKSMRVLITAPSERRLHNLKKETEQIGGRSMFWFANQKILENTGLVDAQWQMAGVKRSVRIL